MAGEKADDAEASVISYDEYGGGRMILDGSPKLVDRSDGPSEFYDLNEHPTEAVNLAGDAAHMSVESDLRSTLRDWFAANENAVDRAWEGGLADAARSSHRARVLTTTRHMSRGP